MHAKRLGQRLASLSTWPNLLSPRLHPHTITQHMHSRAAKLALISTISHTTRVVPQRVRYSTRGIIATLLTTIT